MSSEWVQLWMSRYLVPIDEPGSRLFHWNLFAAFCLFVFWAFFAYGAKNLPVKIKEMVFNKKYWWNTSTKQDYFFFITNSLFKVVLFIPFLDFSFHIASFVSRSLLSFHGDFATLKPTYFNIAIFTTLSFIWDDFLRFFQHYLMHRIPFLWRLHQVHHSAKVLTPVTLYRAHPLESAVATLRNSLSLGVSTGSFIFLFQAQMSLWTIAGVNVFGFLFNLLGANLRHSHIPLGFGSWIERVFISPLQHQIHHSCRKDHFDKNFGVSLACWDVLFGSWMSSGKAGKLKFGLGHVHSRSLLKEYGLPDKKTFKNYRKGLRSRAALWPNPVSVEPTLKVRVVPHRDFSVGQKSL